MHIQSFIIVTALLIASTYARALSTDATLTGTGVGTFYQQEGFPGACGVVYSDSDRVVALDISLYGNPASESQYCFKTIHITNSNTGATVDAIVADACPTCGGTDNLDLSIGAFTAIATLEDGEVPSEYLSTSK